MQQTRVQSLGQEDLLKKEMAAWKMVGKSHHQGSQTGYSPWGHKRLGHDLATEQQHDTCFHFLIFKEHFLTI